MNKLVLLTLSLGLSFGAVAATKPASISALAPYNDSWTSDIKAPFQSNHNDLVAKMKKQEKNRKIASELDQEYFESKMSPEMKKFRDEFLKIKTADELDAKLTELDKNYEKLASDDIKFIAAQLVPMRALRGLVWRLIPTVEDTKIMHSILLTQVKNLAVNMKIFLPTDQWNAAFDYITQPFVQNGHFPYTKTGEAIAQFPKGSELQVQAYIRSVVVPLLRTAALRLEKLDLSEDQVIWDNKLLYGPGSFPSAMDRYSLVGEVEKQISLTYLYGTLSELTYQSAYSQEGGMKMNQQISKLYGWDSFFSQVDGVPASRRIKIIRDSKFSGWGKIFEDGQKWLNSSWTYLARSVEHGELAWTAMKNRQVSEMYLADNSYALPFQRPISLRLDNLKKMIEGPTMIRSFITEETTTVNLKDFYLSPPTDLKDLYATQFEEGPEMNSIPLKTNSGVQKFSYRNYFRGRPTGWKMDVYKRYFPQVKNGADLQNTARILSQGWGSAVVAVPLANYMN
ncbi:MAG: hypothetical protein ACXVLQ_11350 [Bacteriovorax sp.]